jgi:hypothetical protein
MISRPELNPRDPIDREFIICHLSASGLPREGQVYTDTNASAFSIFHLGALVVVLVVFL